MKATDLIATADPRLWCLPYRRYARSFAALARGAPVREFALVCTDEPADFPAPNLKPAVRAVFPACGMALQAMANPVLMPVPVRPGSELCETLPVIEAAHHAIAPDAGLTLVARTPAERLLCLGCDRLDFDMIVAAHAAELHNCPPLPFMDDEEVLCKGLRAWFLKYEPFWRRLLVALPPLRAAVDIVIARLRLRLRTAALTDTILFAGHPLCVLGVMDAVQAGAAGVAHAALPASELVAPWVVRAIDPGVMYGWGYGDVPFVAERFARAGVRAGAAGWRDGVLLELLARTYDRNRADVSPRALISLMRAARTCRDTDPNGRWGLDFEDHLLKGSAACCNPAFTEQLVDLAMQSALEPASADVLPAAVVPVPGQPGAYFLRSDSDCYLIRIPCAPGGAVGRPLRLPVCHDLRPREVAEVAECPVHMAPIQEQLLQERAFAWCASARSHDESALPEAHVRRFTGIIPQRVDIRRTLRMRAQGREDLLYVREDPDCPPPLEEAPPAVLYVWDLSRSTALAENYSVDNRPHAKPRSFYVSFFWTKSRTRRPPMVENRSCFYLRLCQRVHPNTDAVATHKLHDSIKKKCVQSPRGDKAFRAYDHYSVDFALAIAAKWTGASRVVVVSPKAVSFGSRVLDYAASLGVTVLMRSPDELFPTRSLFERLAYDSELPSRGPYHPVLFSELARPVYGLK